MSTQLPQDVIDEIRNAIFEGKKIFAIKLYRDATGTGLKEAKDFIEELADRLYEESPDKFSAAPGSGGCAGMLLAIGCAVGSVVWLVL